MLTPGLALLVFVCLAAHVSSQSPSDALSSSASPIASNTSKLPPWTRLGYPVSRKWGPVNIALVSVFGLACLVWGYVVIRFFLIMRRYKETENEENMVDIYLGLMKKSS